MLLPPLSDPLPSPPAGRTWTDELADEYGFRLTEPPPAAPQSPGFPVAVLLYATDLVEVVVSAFRSP